MKNILFVCTGNTCRSSMAEAMLKDMAKKRNLDINISSRGVSAVDGHRASKQAVRVMKDRGIDITKHRSKLLTKKDIEKADLILTMTTNHKGIVLNLYPEANEKVYTLKEFVYRDIDIDKILDEINDLYKKINEKRAYLMEKRKGEIQKLQRKRREVLKELERVDEELKDWEEEIEAELEDEKAEILRLQKRIPSLDISDPFGQPTDVYRDSADEIRDALEKLIDELIEDN